MPLKYCFLAICVFSSLLHAQSSVRSIGSVNNTVVFQSPNDGDTYVPAKTTLTLRPAIQIVRGHSAQDFSFTVLGKKSGLHAGKVVVSDDNQTLIFQPDSPFALNEEVSVTLAIAGEETIAPLSYRFRITPMSDSEEYCKLNTFKEKEKREITEFQNSQVTKRALESMYFPLDTLPPSFPVITIDTLDESNVTAGNIFLSPSGSNCITIVDNSGNPQFVREIPGNGIQDFTVISPGRLSYFQLEGLPRGNLYLAVLYVLNDHYQVIDTFRCGNGYSTDDHDFRLLPNGHALLVGYDIRDTDLRIITGDSNAAKNATVIGGIIQELDIHKNVVFQWRTWDHLQISDVANYDLTDPNNTVVDYAHLNSIEPDTDGNIIASFRAMDNIVKIRRDSQGAIIWRWGGKNRAINNFTFIGDTLPFSSQHDVRRIANGHITMWDNGNYRKTIWGDGSYHDTSYSRAIEYNLDENLHTATAVWQYGNVPYSFAAGNVQRLPNGNTFIGLGAQNLPNAVEVTPEGKKVFQLSLPKNPLNYRTLRFQWPQPVSVYQLPGSAYSSELREIYPNPAGNLTTVIFSGEKAEIVHFDVINISGTSVLSLTDEIPEAGVYSLRLDVQNVSDGSYFCRFIQNGKISVKPFIVHK